MDGDDVSLGSDFEVDLAEGGDDDDDDFSLGDPEGETDDGVDGTGKANAFDGENDEEFDHDAHAVRLHALHYPA